MAKVGRPTKYKKEFCELLVQHMGEGMSFESFAGHPKVRVARSKIYDWREKHQEFRDAYEKGEAASAHYLEKAALTGALNPKNLPVNTGLFCFFLKNRLGWSDKIEHTGDAAKPITLNYKLNE